MKTNRILGIMIMFVMLLGITIVTTSCDKDEEIEKTSTLIGTWEANDRFLELGSSSWHSYLKNEYGGPQHRRGTYTYIKSSRTIIVSIPAVSGNNGAYTQSFFVQTLNSTSLSLMDLDSGSAYLFKKIK